MKKFLTPAVLLVLMLITVSCKKQEQAVYVEPIIDNPITDYEVTADPTDAFTFNFKNKTTNFQRLEWRFGDDTLKTEVNPSHTYLAAGKYTVDLKAFSKSKATTRKFAVINLIPDSIAQITAVKTGVPNQIQLGLTAKAPIASVLWTFSDGLPLPTSTSLTPVRTFNSGSFNNFTLKITTTKGSVIVLSKSVTTEGLAEDITALRSGYTVSSENTNTNENSAKLVDNNTATKMLFGQASAPYTFPVIFTVQFERPQVIKLYAIANANDGAPRDPKTWTIEGSNDKTTWDVLDSRNQALNFQATLIAAGAPSAANNAAIIGKYFYFPITPTPKPYSFYRWRITANFGDAYFQVAEFKLYR